MTVFEGVSCNNHTAPLGPCWAVRVAFTWKYLSGHVRARRSCGLPAVTKVQGTGHHCKQMLGVIWTTMLEVLLHLKANKKHIYLLSHLSAGHSSHWSQNYHKGHILGSTKGMIIKIWNSNIMMSNCAKIQKVSNKTFFTVRNKVWHEIVNHPHDSPSSSDEALRWSGCVCPRWELSLCLALRLWCRVPLCVWCKVNYLAGSTLFGGFWSPSYRSVSGWLYPWWDKTRQLQPMV